MHTHNDISTTNALSLASIAITHSEVLDMLNVMVRTHRNAAPEIRSATGHAANGAVMFANMLNLISLDEANALADQIFSPHQKGNTQ